VANLLQWYEYYLLATFALGLLQIRTYFVMLRFVLHVPGRWPELYQILRANLNTLLTWPLIVVGGITAGLWSTHVLMRRLVWPGAAVDTGDVAADPLWLGLTAFFATLMVVLDVWSLLRIAPFTPPRMQWLISLTDRALRTHPTRLPLRLFVGWHLRTKLLRNLPILLQWTYRRSAELGARLALGFTLWIGWALQHRAA
jgi:hypothetical protein